jgi:hypothetical protein
MVSSGSPLFAKGGAVPARSIKVPPVGEPVRKGKFSGRNITRLKSSGRTLAVFPPAPRPYRPPA